jgi:hypothetical protein
MAPHRWIATNNRIAREGALIDQQTRVRRWLVGAALFSLCLLVLGHDMKMARATTTTGRNLSNNAFWSRQLSAPTQLIATPSGSDVLLTWVPGTGGDGYTLWGNVSATPGCQGLTYAQIAQVAGGAATNYVDRGRAIPTGLYYCYELMTTQGPWSSQVTNPVASVAGPPPPTATASVLTPVSGLSATQVTAGDSYSCALQSNQKASCWGLNSSGQTNVPQTATFQQISSGESHSCGVKSDGTIACWGANPDGRATPPGGKYRQVAAGRSHTCAIRDDQGISCWGDNSQGQAAAPTGTFLQVSAGNNYTCAVDDKNKLQCWGQNGNAPRPPTATYVQVSVGDGFACALKKGPDHAECWRTSGDFNIPVPQDVIVQVSASLGVVACGVNDHKSVKCWVSAPASLSSPPAGLFSQVAVGKMHACGLQSDSAVTCWGSNSYGEASPKANSH